MSDEVRAGITKEDDMLPDYDFSKGLQGQHANLWGRPHKVRIYKQDGTVEEQDFPPPDGTVVLDPDVLEYFPDSETVNRALRGLIELIPHKQPPEPAP